MTALRPLLVAALIALAGAAAAEGVPEPQGYRMDAYRAPVPETLTGASVVGVEGAHALWQAGVPFLDVMPRPEKPAGLPEGTIWIDRKRDSIPGALWVPNVGYGAVDPALDARFRRVLDRVTGGDPDRPVVIFCERDCWMSWNAARRAAAEYGYTRVFWYPDGTTGWAGAGHPLERIDTAE